MEMKQKLIPDLVQTPTPSPPQYFIYRYNHVINVYNTHINSPDQELDLLDSNQSFQKINKAFEQRSVKVSMVVLLAFVPFLNLAILGLLFFYYMFLLREEPSETLLFLAGCLLSVGEALHNNDTEDSRERYDYEDLEGFTFNTDLYQELKAKGSNEEEITVTIYDQYFYDSYHLFRKEQYGTAAWILLAIFLVAVDAIFYVELFELK